MSHILMNRAVNNTAAMNQKAKYFPEVYHEVLKESNSSGIDTVVHILATKLRVYNHNDKEWIVKHHNVTRFGSLKEAYHELMKSVYLDIIFGTRNRKVTNADGKPLDPVDDLQQSESERLLGVKG